MGSQNKTMSTRPDFFDWLDDFEKRLAPPANLERCDDGRIKPHATDFKGAKEVRKTMWNC